MRIAVLSDTHGFIDDDVLKFIEECDEVWHAGDLGPGVYDALAAIKPLVAVYGNIDGSDMRSFLKEFLYFEREGYRVLMTHIGGHPGHYPQVIKELLNQYKPSIFVCGHSHILRAMPDKKYNMLYINPGACGNSGFHLVKTVMRFTLGKEGPVNMDIFEKKRRG